MPIETETSSPSPMVRSTWLTVFVVELAVISIINGFTILTFARNRHLRKRTTYLIIRLTIADFFVGTVSVPLHIYINMTFERSSGFGWGKFIVLLWKALFITCSLLDLALLIISVLFTVIVSYVVIALNVKIKAPPYPFDAVSPERELTVTLLIVIVLSTVTFFPSFFLHFL